jgi:signal transduction histidine kinase
MRLYVLSLLAAAMILGTVAGAWAADQKSVLVIYSTRRDTQIAIKGDQQIPVLLEHGLGQMPDYYSEYIDGARFPEAQYKEAFRDYLRLKYQLADFDVIIAVQRLAFEFVSSYHDELFPGAPIVFLNDNPRAARPSNSTGVIVEPDYRRTIVLARKLDPQLANVFLVVGSSARDKAMERAVRTQLDAFPTDLKLTYLTDMTTDEIERRVAALPERSMVYYLLVYQDAAGVNLNPLDYLGRLSAMANRPTYSWVDSTIGRGIVGGSLLTVEAELRGLAATALRVLHRESPDRIPMTTLDVQQDRVDWRQIQRWQIDEMRIPASAIVMYRQPSAFERYRWFIAGVLALMLAQTALIAGLLVERTKRRRAEERARTSREELTVSYERIRDMGGRLLAAQENERARIARELHDDISQQMTLLSIDLELLGNVGRQRIDQAQKLAHEALLRSREITKGVHDISHRLHPAKLRLIGLVGALSSLARELSSTDLTVSFTHENVPDEIPHDLALCLYRIAQEAVHNAIHHGHARRIRMNLYSRSGALTLTVVDDGMGFDPKAVGEKGLGLISMRERLEPFGGTLSIQSTPGGGASVEAVVPSLVAPLIEAS